MDQPPPPSQPQPKPKLDPVSEQPAKVQVHVHVHDDEEEDGKRGRGGVKDKKQKQRKQQQQQQQPSKQHSQHHQEQHHQQQEQDGAHVNFDFSPSPRLVTLCCAVLLRDCHAAELLDPTLSGLLTNAALRLLRGTSFHASDQQHNQHHNQHQHQRQSQSQFQKQNKSQKQKQNPQHEPSTSTHPSNKKPCHPPQSTKQQQQQKQHEPRHGQDQDQQETDDAQHQFIGNSHHLDFFGPLTTLNSIDPSVLLIDAITTRLSHKQPALVQAITNNNSVTTTAGSSEMFSVLSWLAKSTLAQAITQRLPRPSSPSLFLPSSANPSPPELPARLPGCLVRVFENSTTMGLNNNVNARNKEQQFAAVNSYPLILHFVLAFVRIALGLDEDLSLNLGDADAEGADSQDNTAMRPSCGAPTTNSCPQNSSECESSSTHTPEPTSLPPHSTPAPKAIVCSDAWRSAIQQRVLELDKAVVDIIRAWAVDDKLCVSLEASAASKALSHHCLISASFSPSFSAQLSPSLSSSSVAVGSKTQGAKEAVTVRESILEVLKAFNVVIKTSTPSSSSSSSSSRK